MRNLVSIGSVLQSDLALYRVFTTFGGANEI
jgi:hypothetical protein